MSWCQKCIISLWNSDCNGTVLEYYVLSYFPPAALEVFISTRSLHIWPLALVQANQLSTWQ